ncbi:MAG: peptide ABC transporter substrate-binding protein [Candidatus Liptonbacteria bacterium]|nr:peptide ABC transporter substrate-binding protein [Candidatus Liptonbacteria bacterium]
MGQPSFVNPLLAESVADKNLVRLTFSNLTDLADNIEGDKNGRSFRVHLKENLFWSNGQKLTSDDVIFTLQKLQDPQTGSPYFSNWQGVVANRTSELEVQFNLVAPYAFFTESLDNLYVVPKHLFADTPPANWKLSDYNLKPVGSGPFMFKTYEKRSDGFITDYRLEPNPYYAGDKPYVENFNFRFFAKPEDVLKSFNSGQIEAVADLEPGAIKNIRRTYDIREFSLPNYYAVFLNQSQNLALQESAVRAALSLSVDRPALIREVLLGYGRASTGPIPGNLPATRVSAPGENYDPDSAALILDGAGWKMSTSGIREKTIKSSALKLQFKLTVPDISFLVSTAKSLANSWRKIGISAELNILPPGDILSGPIKNRDYQAVLFGNLLGPNGDLYAFWHSSQKYYPGLNLSLFGSKNTDKLLESIRQNSDEESRNSQLQSAVDAISQTYPAVFLYSPSELFVSSKDLGGVQSGFLGDASDRLIDAKKWYVRVTRIFK